MKRALSLIIMLVALVALAGPSLSRGLDGVWVSAGSTVTAQDADDLHASLWGCKKMGGKRVMPCHPDLGVLAPASLPVVRGHGGVSAPQTGPAGLASLPEAELPPPRLG